MARCYKPRPELFHEMLNLLNLPPQDTVYVGDRHYEDVYGATCVGMNAVWVDRGDRGLREDIPAPSHKVSSLLELPELLEGISSRD